MKLERHLLKYPPPPFLSACHLSSAVPILHYPDKNQCVSRRPLLRSTGEEVMISIGNFSWPDPFKLFCQIRPLWLWGALRARNWGSRLKFHWWTGNRMKWHAQESEHLGGWIQVCGCQNWVLIQASGGIKSSINLRTQNNLIPGCHILIAWLCICYITSPKLPFFFFID